MVPTLNLGPFEVRVIWDTGASKTIGGMHEEEAIFRGANHVRIGAGIHRRYDREDLWKAWGVRDSSGSPDLDSGLGPSNRSSRYHRKPTDNAFIEWFNARDRIECLNAHVFESIEDAKDILTNWRNHYKIAKRHGYADTYGVCCIKSEERGHSRPNISG